MIGLLRTVVLLGAAVAVACTAQAHRAQQNTTAAPAGAKVRK